MDNADRRKFLRFCLGGFAAVAVAGILYPVYRFLAPRDVADAGGKVAIPEKDLAENGAKFFQYAGSAAVIVRTREGRVLALSAVCTHLGCVVQWEKEKQSFLCPCHGGRYSADGAVIAGPPPKPLARLPVSVVDGNIIVG